MDIKNSFEKFFDESFIKDFVTAQAGEPRDSASFIVSYALLLESEQLENPTLEMRRKFAEGLKKQCCHILQLSDFYAQIFEVIFNPSLSAKLMNIKDFFDNFAECVQKSLEGICSVETNFGGEIYAAINQKMLKYVLLMYIRSVVLDGAEDIKLSYAGDDEKLIIEVSAGKKSDSRRLQYPDDDFLGKYHKDINTFFVNKLGGELHEDKNGMKMIFTKAIDETENVLMQESESAVSMDVLNPYNVMLSDLSEKLI